MIYSYTLLHSLFCMTSKACDIAINYLKNIKKLVNDPTPDCQQKNNQEIGQNLQAIIGLLQKEQILYQRDRIHHIQQSCSKCKK